ncbi:structural protein [Bermanella marisrubri]|uniref:Structural protein P5 n=1 Tax=Bermanella marisrubri TaxID=207949 RepID=Q1N4P5_9GAMM|nr:hypothetical protein [Bermanella marisrubri]EAT13383.1 hypothetical protein RED65_01445 [Oceanobacter sp. RED65] [Bermanella marisrubri]QIZ84137.1 structural protein [Bermanella marisrubri]
MKWWLAGLGVLGFMAYKFKPVALVRGVRNNNPGNIRSTVSDYWEGQIGTDGSFAIFESPEFGIRAMGRTLMNYDRLYGLNTVSEIISRWAPSNENNTEAYIDAVADELGVFTFWPLDLNDADRLTQLIKAIIKHENGIQPYSDDLIARGVRLAGESFA